MKVEGRCHCGAIAYEAVVDPLRVTVCHCTDCQCLTGSGWRASVPATSETFVLQSGEPRRYVKTADSGRRRVHAFCGDCGAPVYSSAIEAPESYSLRVGCLAQRAALSPVRQQWCDSALPWAQNLASVPRLSKQ